jgi:mono/diheme cytochrome c family protein
VHKPNPLRHRVVLTLSALGSIGAVLAALAVTSPPADAQTPPAEGVAQYNRACGRCHTNPHDDDDIGPNIANKRLTTEAMTKVIREGTKRMRPIAPTKLSDADLARVMVFLRSIHAVR